MTDDFFTASRPGLHTPHALPVDLFHETARDWVLSLDPSPIVNQHALPASPGVLDVRQDVCSIP